MIIFRFLIALLLIHSAVQAQDLQPTVDSCLLNYTLLSEDSIPYSGMSISFENLDDGSQSYLTTDALGCVKILLLKDVDYNINIYEGRVLHQTFAFHTPPNKGLVRFQYSNLMNIFIEDKVGEQYVYDRYSNADSLVSDEHNLVLQVSLHLPNNSDQSNIDERVIIFKDIQTKTVYYGKTNQQGRFSILLPRGNMYASRLVINGIRLPIDTLNVPTDKGVNEMSYDVIDSEICIMEHYMESFKIDSQKTSQHFVLDDVFFDFDKATLQKRSYTSLYKIVAMLKENPQKQIELSGHTDSVGDDHYNLKLSDRRAASVRNFIIENGIDPNRISSIGYGETKPRETNDTEEGRDLNRRTEMVVFE